MAAWLLEVKQPFNGYPSEMVGHPTAGRSLRNYIILTECPELPSRLGLTKDERFWSRYYWMARFAREWQAVAGCDAGLEQQVVQLLKSAEHIPIAYDPLPEVEAAVERDAVVLPPG